MFNSKRFTRDIELSQSKNFQGSKQIDQITMQKDRIYGKIMKIRKYSRTCRMPSLQMKPKTGSFFPSTKPTWNMEISKLSLMKFG